MDKDFKIEAIFFDVGNVLWSIDWPKDFRTDHFSKFSLFEEYEKGLIDSLTFQKELEKILDKNFEQEEFKNLWCQCLRHGPINGVRELTEKIIPNVELYTLSNTNELHFDFFKKDPLFKNFKKLFVSHELFSRKPEKEIFLKALKESQKKAERILFIDDLLPHVEMAKNLGFQTEHSQSTSEDLKKILIKYKLLHLGPTKDS